MLADIFENFLDISLQNYQLDPAKYVRCPQLSLDAMLFFTEGDLNLSQTLKCFSFEITVCLVEFQ